MKEMKDSFDYADEQDLFSIKDAFLKYLRYWPFFLGFIFFCLFIGFLYNRYSSVTYLTTAKIKIIDDDSELDIAKDPSTLFWSDTKINMENEIEVIKSFRLLNQVVTSLNLDISYYYKGFFKTSEIWNQPFIITDHVMPEDAIDPIGFEIELLKEGFLITDDFDNEYRVNYDENGISTEGLPFNIKLIKNTIIENHEDDTYQVVIYPKKDATMNLTNSLQVQPSSKKSEILQLWLVNESSERSENILNETIKKFDEDGILDRQRVSKRTLDFLDERFLYLSGELDSIEAGKQGFKQQNDLSYIEEDATSILSKKSTAEDEVFELETQISLANLLNSAVRKEKDYGLLPSDIGLENLSINKLVSEYNMLALERSKIIKEVGPSHPTLLDLNTQLKSAKQSFLKSLNVFRRQLSTSLAKLNTQKDVADEMFARLPEKEKLMRSIDRQQSIKEKLFLLLLQKREEAAVNFAVTAPTIKVVDYGLTAKKPISPNKLIVYSICLFLGFTIPFLTLYTRFFLDDKVHSSADLSDVKSQLPIISEIPFLAENKLFTEAGDRSVLAESFRILSTNISYYLKSLPNDKGKVIYVTSAIKGEGKTLTALNVSLAYANLKKNVLLVGADLRNPQLHKYYDNQDHFGLSEYLLYPETDWRETVNNGINNNQYHKITFAGKIPYNPSELLAGNEFGDFLASAKSIFDYVVVDTAPTMLVTDTMLISEYADITLFLVRANFTKKRVLEFSKDLYKKDKLKNMAYVLNAVGKEDNDYNYGYQYGYGGGNSFEELSAKPTVYSTLKKVYKKLLSISIIGIEKTMNLVRKNLSKKEKF